MITEMELSKQDRDTLERLETELWRVESRHDRSLISEVIAPDFFEFGRSGRIYDRDETINTSGAPIDAVLPLQGFKARLLSDDVAQVTYNSAVTYDGVVQYGRRSSIWSKHSGTWKLRFHQGTPFESAT